MIIYQFENIGNAYDYKNNHHSDWFVPSHLHEYSEFKNDWHEMMSIYTFIAKEDKNEEG